MEHKEPILDIKNLSVSFRMYEKGLEQKDLKVISNLNIHVDEGEILAIVGSSGSGKSLLASTVLGILPKNASVTGDMRYYGQPMTIELQQRLRGREIALVPQSVEYLDPLMKTGKQVVGVRGTKEKQRLAFKRYGLQREVEELYPFQLSGGMARRVLVSTAVIGDAKLIVADEPTPGMSKAMAEEAMSNFRTLADEGKGIILITHDIDLAFEYADRIAIFYAGTTVETALAEDFGRGPEALRHPYSKALWEALPQNGFKPIPGTQPYAGSIPGGCLFAPRCLYKTEECLGEIPMRTLRGGEVCCIHAD
ncbi:oligopeptide/dipeptide ABC transporter ATP-binding protein [Bariatricus sp. SGI.154]|uniref:oligopeptide/dipeptide ABC transporter ATP-binding protein n=1 Tax=Bariatricus sp. SGI.154 TaxID=3420549 RepID=UPI003D0171DC